MLRLCDADLSPGDRLPCCVNHPHHSVGFSISLNDSPCGRHNLLLAFRHFGCPLTDVINQSRRSSALWWKKSQIVCSPPKNSPRGIFVNLTVLAISVFAYVPRLEISSRASINRSPSP